MRGDFRPWAASRVIEKTRGPDPCQLRSLMARRFRDRGSFKASEVVGLFLLSMMSTMFICIVLSTIYDILRVMFP